MNSSVADAVRTPHPYRWVMLATGWLAYLGFGLTSNSMAPLVAQITTELGISNSAMGFILGTWQLVYIGSAFLCGAFIDRYGVRRGILVAGALIILSGVLRAEAGGFTTLLLAVGIFGLGGPLISIGSPKLVSQWFGPAERGRAMGIIITGVAVGAILSLTLTHSVLMPLFHGNWRHVMLAYAGAMLAATLLWWLVNLHPAARGVERHAAAEHKPPQLETLRALLALPAVRIVMLMNIGSFAFTHAFNNWLPELLRHGGMASEAAGYWASIPPLVGIFASPILGRFATPERRFRVLALLFTASLSATILLQFSSGPAMLFGLVLQGLTRGALTAVVMMVLIETRGVGTKNAGAAGGLYFTAGEIGGLLGPFLMGVAYDASGGFGLALGSTSVLLAGLIVLVWFLRRADAAHREG